MNTFGKYIRLTTFGESHGPAMGGILDGMPSRVQIDRQRVQDELDRRAPGRQPNTSARREPDKVEILSGITDEGLTLGSPIGFIIRNCDAHSADYAGYQEKFRPNHADYTYYKKYGVHDFRGGGRASARETVNWVVGGAICRQWLETFGIKVSAGLIETNNIADTASKGDSTGAIVSGLIEGLPVGVGEPVFDKLSSRLAAAMMSINAVKAFEYGDGAKAAEMLGSQSLDVPFIDAATGKVSFNANHSGGIQGGISNGMPVNFEVYFKPTPTLMQQVETIDAAGDRVVIDPKGRHDPCVAVRGVAVVEAMALLAVADLMRIQWHDNV
ncbi:MAG: chorismate synthase [Bacteroidales bacterium]|nr:chorismate synthase [Bacteroidales bacterium]